MACLNSVLAVPERLFFHDKVTKTDLHPSPVFVLGHPRTGTTLLHSLLALDDRFAYCNTFCAGFPSCFLWFEGVGKRLFAGVMDETRPMDNVKLDFDLPQEDELATNVLSGGAVSPYMPLFLMKQEAEFRPFYAFDNKRDGRSHDEKENNNDNGARHDKDENLPDEQMSVARKQWTDAFLWLCRKLTLRATKTSPLPSNTTTPKPLLLKSPVHTARIRLLLNLFPDAKFVYIHRHPFDVFRSAAHMADTTYWYTYLNSPTDEEIQEFILRQYEILWERYEEGRELLLSLPNTNSNETNTDRLVEISFEELTASPIETLQNLYRRFGWEREWERGMEQTYRSELDGVKSFERNQHNELSDELKKVVEKRWGGSFRRLGYTVTQQPGR